MLAATVARVYTHIHPHPHKCPFCAILLQVRLSLNARYTATTAFTPPSFIGPDAHTLHYVNAYNRADDGDDVAACLQPDMTLPDAW